MIDGMISVMLVVVVVVIVTTFIFLANAFFSEPTGASGPP